MRPGLASIGALSLALATFASLPADAPAATAQAASTRAPQPPVTPVTTGFEGPLPPRVGLSLDDAILLGLVHNLDVEIARHAPLIAAEDARIAWGGFDPVFRTDFGYKGEETPVASSLQTSSLLVERTIEGTSSLAGMIPLWGAQYSVSYTGQSLETNSSISSLSPEYRTILRFGLTAPLLRNFLWSEPWTQVRATRIAHRQSADQFRQALMDTVRSIEDAYWSLGAARESLGVADKSLETARELLHRRQIELDVEVIAAWEVAEAEAGVAERELNRIRAEAALDRAQDQLVDLVFGPALHPELEIEILPTDPGREYRAYQVDREQATRKAFAKRPALAVARRQIEAREILLKFARNQRLPQLDIQVTYGFQGLSGKENPDRLDFGAGGREQAIATNEMITGINDINAIVAPTADEIPLVAVPDEPAPLQIDRRYSSADDDFFSADGAHQFTAMGILSIPIFNIAARHRVTREELELRRARTRLKRQEQKIILEIRDAVRGLEAALKGIQAAERRQEAARVQLEAAEARREEGELTDFDVLLRDEDLVEAESQRIEALEIYHNSVTALARAQGTILESRNIAVEDYGALR